MLCVPPISAMKNRLLSAYVALVLNLSKGILAVVFPFSSYRIASRSPPVLHVFATTVCVGAYWKKG
ncbi:hypothetical protein BDW75DRAFT_226676 [Aspergillus navahoensis]